jgi:hypothetical protein
MLNGPPGAYYNVSTRGWMESEQFLDWFKRAFLSGIQSSPGPHLLLLDGHASHIGLELVQLAKENQVHILCFPPHSSHLYQPLDVAVYSPVKYQWKKIVTEHFRSTGFRNVDKDAFAQLFAKIKDSNKAFQRRHAVAGFEASGKWFY